MLKTKFQFLKKARLSILPLLVLGMVGVKTIDAKTVTSKNKSTHKTPAFNTTFPMYRTVLSRFVCVKGVNYSALKKSQTLDSAAKDFAMDASTFNALEKTDQLAYLINRYNFETLRLIIKHYPVKSIRDIEAPWKQEFITLFGKPASLDHLEADWIRKRYNEARIHFAVNCASISCPALATEPYEGKKLDAQLEQSAKLFLLNRDHNQFSEKSAQISHIFDWYGDDFKPGYGSAVGFIEKTLGTKLPAAHSYREYNWNLNQADCEISPPQLLPAPAVQPKQ